VARRPEGERLEGVAVTLFLWRMEVEHAARKHQLDPDLVESVCRVESDGHRWAWNPEPHYRYLWNVKTQRPFRALTATERASETPPADFPCLAGDRDQEFWGQQASWGLMQVMGAVAREYGFQEPYLSQLCEVRYGLEFGCTVLAARLRWAKGDQAKALAAYNAGQGGWENGQGYAVKVLTRLKHVQEMRRV
jgi:hypothetical protein